MRSGRVALRSHGVRRDSTRPATRTLTAAPSRAMPAGTRAIAVRAVGGDPRLQRACRPGAPRRARRRRAHPRRRRAPRGPTKSAATAPIDGRRRIDSERALDDRLVAGAVARDGAQHVRALAGDRDRRARAPATADAVEQHLREGRAVRVGDGQAHRLRAAAPAQGAAHGHRRRLLVDQRAAHAGGGRGEPGARDRADGEADLGRAADRRRRDRGARSYPGRPPASPWRRAPARAPPRRSGRLPVNAPAMPLAAERGAERGPGQVRAVACGEQAERRRRRVGRRRRRHCRPSAAPRATRSRSGLRRRTRRRRARRRRRRASAAAGIDAAGQRAARRPARARRRPTGRTRAGASCTTSGAVARRHRQRDRRMAPPAGRGGGGIGHDVDERLRPGAVRSTRNANGP